MEASERALVSVIIPTFNRKGSVLRLLECLKQQTYPCDRFEVIVVDDGSTDGTDHLPWNSFPFGVRYYRQENAGATLARNRGASQSSAEILVFMDDDICPTPSMLEELVRTVQGSEKTIALAALIPVFDPATTPFASLYSSGAVFDKDVDVTESVLEQAQRSKMDGYLIHFSRCKTGVLSIRRHDFLALGMFQDPTGGWPNWDDVDLGYRGYLHGFHLWQSYRAIAYHHDHSLASLEANCKRAEQASRSVVRLFRRYPELWPHFSAYHSKQPLSLRSDSAGLLVRKAIWSVMSSPPLLRAMKQLTLLLEKHRPQSRLLVPLYRAIIGAHIRKGYRQGQRELSLGVR
ncbi:MAG: glycosyltransferase family 2 protein [Anaerolineae bacterium]|nr:glycosyltransferase family 2 protein [Anaerolineae bacterium]